MNRIRLNSSKVNEKRLIELSKDYVTVMANTWKEWN